MRNRLRIALDHQGRSFFDAVRPYLEGVVAVALMAVMGIVSAFVTTGVTGDSGLSVPMAVATFILTGAFLVYRHWRALQRAGRVQLD